MSTVAVGLASTDVGLVEIPLLATLTAQVNSMRERVLSTACENTGRVRLDAASTGSATLITAGVIVVPLRARAQSRGKRATHWANAFMYRSTNARVLSTTSRP